MNSLTQPPKTECEQNEGTTKDENLMNKKAN